MQLQCNTKEFKQLEFGKIYECTDKGMVKLQKLCYPMVEVTITPNNKQCFGRIHFTEVDEQTKDLIQDNPTEEITPDVDAYVNPNHDVDDF